MNKSSLKMLVVPMIAFMFSPVTLSAKEVKGTAYLSDKAPKTCKFVETTDVQKGCGHEACNLAVKNAITKLQDAQPTTPEVMDGKSNKCKREVKSRGCEYTGCKH
jgi:hypothetical protein